MLNKLDPVNGNTTTDTRIQQFSWPQTKSGLLPGGYHYFHTSIPFDPLEEKIKGRSLITTRAEDDSYLRIQVDEFGYLVSGLTIS